MALKHFLTMSVYHTWSVVVNNIFGKHNREKFVFNFAELKFILRQLFQSKSVKALTD
jgi:hypothetical protein